MKFLRFIGWLIVLIAALVFVLPLFLADYVEFSQETYIKAKPETVFRQVNNLKNWSNWSAWTNNDPDMQSEFNGPVSGKGSSHSWKSKQMGDGSMTITDSKAYSYVLSKLDFGTRGIVEDHWTFDQEADSVMVRWKFKAINLTYPLGKLNGLVIKVMMRSYQRTGLSQLKTYCESLPEPAVVHEAMFDHQLAIMLDDSSRKAGIDKSIQQGLSKLFDQVATLKLDTTGAPFAVFYNWDTTAFIHFRLGIPVVLEGTDTSKASFFVHERGRSLTTVLSGPSEH
ncbi:MAG: SRPBCC family protein, partial [Bacteroidales bacterium]|nr:SRPBCC family protein [Bacteroidales bacterium]